MSTRSLAHLRDVYGPECFFLGVEEVCAVLKKTTRGQRNGVRKKLKAGVIPGARKVDRQWMIPVEDVAELIEPTPGAMPAPPLPKGGTGSGRRGRTKAELGELIGAFRATGFWSRVAEALGWEQEAELLSKGAIEIIEELRRAAALEQRARFEVSFAPATRPTGGRGPDTTL